MKKKLQTDILEERYGIIHSKVLTHTKDKREVFLLDQKGIVREYAFTFFPEVDNRLSVINRKIRRGGLIGKTFRDNGYDIIKRKKKNFIIELPVWLKKEFSTDERSAQASMYEFCVRKEAGSLKTYGFIFDIYNPK